MSIAQKTVFAIIGAGLLVAGEHGTALARPPFPLPPPPSGVAKKHTVKHQYRYYPAEEVYFDPGRRVYFYQDGKKWRKATALPKRLRLAPDYVVIDMDDDKPFREFHRHREMYPRHHRHARHHRPRHEYRYYPQEQVYFDPGREVYFHLERGNWRMTATLPRPLRLTPDYVVIDMDDDQPYREFDRHRDMYPRHRRHERHRRPRHEYRYYPQEQVYFDPGREVYFFMERGNWRMMATLPRPMRLAPDYVVIDMDDDEPYREFDRHRDMYPRYRRHAERQYDDRRGDDRQYDDRQYDDRRGDDREHENREYRTKRHYRYFPREQVYFDPGRKVYFYLDQKNWRMGVTLPDPMRFNENDFVTIDMDQEEPYREFDRHKTMYPPEQQTRRYERERRD